MTTGTARRDRHTPSQRQRLIARAREWLAECDAPADATKWSHRAVAERLGVGQYLVTELLAELDTEGQAHGTQNPAAPAEGIER